MPMPSKEPLWKQPPSVITGIVIVCITFTVAHIIYRIEAYQSKKAAWEYTEILSKEETKRMELIRDIVIEVNRGELI